MIEPKKRAVDRIYSDLPQDLQSLMKKYCLSDEVDAMERGVEDEHAKVLEDIKAISYFNKAPSDNPTFIIVVGQTGSGKSNLSAEILRKNKKQNIDVVKIDSDEYKAYRSDSLEIQRKFLSKYGFLTAPDSYRHRDEMIVDAMDKKYNILLEVAPSVKDGLFIDIDKIMQQGYNVELNVIAVSRLNSLLSIHERYEDQLRSNYSAAKLTSISRHDDSYNSLNYAIMKANDKGVAINVYKRGINIPYIPFMIYSSTDDDKRFRTPLDAINSVRANDERDTIRNFNSRYSIIQSQMTLRNAPIEQQNQLHKIGELYEKQGKFKI